MSGPRSNSPEFLAGLRGVFQAAASAASSSSEEPKKINICVCGKCPSQEDHEETVKSRPMLLLLNKMKKMTKRECRSSAFDRLAMLVKLAGNVDHHYYWPKKFRPETRDAHVAYFNAMRDAAMKMADAEIPTEIVLSVREFERKNPRITNSHLAKYAHYIFTALAQQLIFQKLEERAAQLQRHLNLEERAEQLKSQLNEEEK